MLKLENSIRGLSFSRVAFDLTIQGYWSKNEVPLRYVVFNGPHCGEGLFFYRVGYCTD